MKKLSAILAFVFSFYLCANAQVLLTENFDYPAGDSIGAHGWVTFSGTTNVLTVVSPGLTYTGYQLSGIGNACRLNNNGYDAYKGFTGDSVTSGSLYASFMINIDSAKTGDYFFTMLPNSSTTIFLPRVYVKDSSGTLSFGVSKGPNASAPAYGPNGLLYHTTYLVVVKYKFNTGSTTDDEISLFVFNSTPPTTEPVTPYVGPFTSSTTDAVSLGRVVLRQGSASSAPTLNIDGILVKTAWPISAPLSWSEQTSGITSVLYSVSAVDNNIVWVCGAAGKVLRTINSGANWASVGGGTIPSSLALYNIWGIDANSALVTGSSSSETFVYYTSNAGTNWTQIFNQTGGFIDNIWMTSATNGFMNGDAVGSRWSLWKTTNGGLNWDSTGLYLAQNGTETGYNNSMYVDGNNIWMGTSTNRTYYSTNSGASWTTQTVGIQVGINAIWSNNSASGKLLCGSDSLMVTTNFGTNWDLAGVEPGAGAIINGITGNSTEWWLTRQATSVYYSATDGASWVTHYTAPAGSFYSLGKARTGTYIWGIRSNGGISRYGQPISGIQNITVSIPENYSLSQNYPNPFNPTTKINFSIPKSGLVSLKVYDLLGREITTLVNEVKISGTYLVDFNASTLSSGVYFYKLESNGFSQVKKMMLIK
jgi:hypothetical protein